VAHQSGSLDRDAQEQSVAVAVRMRGDHSQAIARALTFRPELVAGTAEKCNVAFLQGAFHGRAIHKAHHQNFPVGRILHYRGEQAAHLFEIKICIHNCFSQQNQNPLSVCRVSGPEFLELLVISGVHPRRHAMRMVMVAVMKMGQHY
jgi:hypothetical protein